jgi:chemotaxis protein CheD
VSARLAPAFAASADVTAERQVIDIFLQPGEVYFGDAETRIRTVLGSCVAVTLWHRERRIGGMCHFMLPARGRPAAPDGGNEFNELDGRYGDEAIELLMREIRRHRSHAADYEVKVFGGGNMFPHAARGNGDVGRRNGDFALERLAAVGLPIARHHLAGNGHRQVVFEVWSGDVWLRHASAAAEAGS